MSAPIKTRVVHRVAYEIMKKIVLTSDMLLCHHCDNPLCWRPTRMYIGTPQDNVNDKVRKIRQAKGITLNRARKVQKLLLQGYACRAITRKTGISRKTIQNIRDGKHWSLHIR